MDLSFHEADEQFRMDVRAYFENEYPQDIVEKLKRGEKPSKADVQRSEQSLTSKGWLAVNWPKKFGGTGWSVTQKYIFDEELERVGALGVSPMGLLYVAPVLYTFGTKAQQERWLPGILNSTVFWAQGYSEPESGSDLASLQSSAVRDGDEYVVNGTKIWTTDGQYGDWIFCLLRTDNSGKKQEGISFICIDMTTPGITVRPIITLDGNHTLNQIEFENVRVPAENLIGEEGKGWTYSKYLLGHERTSYAHIAAKREKLEGVKRAAATVSVDGGTLWDDGAFRAKVGMIEAELDALEFTLLRAIASLTEGDAPGDAASALKILATENHQHIDELFIEVLGIYGAPFDLEMSNASLATNSLQVPPYAFPMMRQYFGNRAQSIYGGTNEIQKNVIAKAVLGLG